MSHRPSTFDSIPSAVKVGAGIVVGGGVVGALALLANSKTAIIIVVLGLVLIGLAVLVYSLFTKAAQKRQASMMQSTVAGHGGATPTGIANPARRARLDDLRKNFETGINKFRQADKDVYSVPWYIVVGEPGSGKTEAIRHCKIGFPPGLQDALQGVGGTVNMNWWFTNHGVFLDTAGRLMFEEVEAGSSGEWQEFLKLLTKARPNCPINGMFLFIPADSLVKDSADAIERKGSKIAQQLDAIQRVLGVRFPVYVIISKSDLVNGFREFFDEITDPKLQDQILGWANPSPLDTPFKPELVEDHLKQVQQRLVRRRLGLMMDPVHTDDPKLRRADQIDAMYAFPDSLTKLSSRLRRYLEMVFVAGQWSAKPLFLRGIFFTSSMREGSALDQELAEALGVAIDKLPEGKVWEKDRSFFLRDMFVEKAFAEQGLVSRASSVSKQLQRWKRTVVGLSFGGIALLTLFTVLGYRALDKNIVTPSQFWDQSSKVFKAGERIAPTGEKYLLPVLARKPDAASSASGPLGPTYEYLGNDKLINQQINGIAGVPSESASLGKFPLQLRARAEEPVAVPSVFRPIAALFGDTSNLAQTERVEAARVLLESSWLRPLIDASKQKLSQDVAASRWSSHATAALTQLLRVELASIRDLPQRPAMPELKPLIRFALQGDDAAIQAAEADINNWEDRTYNWLYAKEGARQDWPSPAFRASNLRILSDGVQGFTNTWSGHNGPVTDPAAGQFADIKSLLNTLQQLNTNEQALLATEFGTDRSAAAKLWSDRLKTLADLQPAIDSGLSKLNKRPLRQAYADELKTYREFARKQHDALIRELDAFKREEPSKLSKLALSAPNNDRRIKPLDEMRQQLVESLSKLDAPSPETDADLQVAAKLDAMFLALSTQADPTITSRLSTYRQVESRMTAPPVTLDPKPGSIGSALRSIDQTLATETAAVDASRKLPDAAADPNTASASERAALAADKAKAAFAYVAQSDRSDVIARFIQRASRSAADFQVAVNQVAGSATDLVKPAIPASSWSGDSSFEPRFSPKAADTVLADYIDIARALAPPSAASPTAGTTFADSSPRLFKPESLREQFEVPRKAAEGYLVLFAGYWIGQAVEDLSVQGRSWSELRTAIARGDGGGGGGGGGMNSALAGVVNKLDEASKSLAAAALLQSDPSQSTRLAKFVAGARASLDAAAPRVDAVLQAWLALPEAPGQARQTFLDRGSAIPSTFLVLVGKGDLSDDFVARFYREFSRRVVRSLAEAPVINPAATALDSVRTLGIRFPIGQLEGGILSLDDIQQLRVALATLSAAAQAGSAGAGGPIESGDTQITSDLAKMLSESRIRPSDAKLADEVRRVLDALFPEGSGPLRVEVRVAGRESGRPGSIASVIPLARLTVAGQPGPEFRLFEVKPDDYVLGQTELPLTGPLQFTFRGDAGESGSADIPNLWAPLSMIEGLKRTPGNGRSEWLVDLPVPYSGTTYTLQLKLKFNRPLPTLNWLP